MCYFIIYLFLFLDLSGSKFTLSLSFKMNNMNEQSIEIEYEVTYPSLIESYVQNAIHKGTSNIPNSQGDAQR